MTYDSKNPGDLENISRTGRHWIYSAFHEKDVQFLRQKYNVCDMTARIAACRLKDPEEADGIFFPFLKNQLPDPSYLPDHQKAYDHLYRVMQKNTPLAVWGDYDVDGACSSALMVKYFEALDIPITAYIPDRFQEGYGPNITGFRYLKSKGIQDIFVVDCGTTAFQVMDQAKAENLNIIIIDHHRVAPTHPDVLAFINPKRQDAQCPSLLQQLCAGGLVFLFLVGLNRHLRWKNFFESTGKKEPDLFSFLDLVALSTICDMMPLRHVNRAFVKQGLKVMRQRKNVGLTCLIDASKIKDIPNPVHLAYTVGPRINAGGRIGDASLGVRLLSCTDKKESFKLAQDLNALNQERQTIERLTLEKAILQAEAQIHSPFVFVFGENWHEGVLGIIASHLKENFFKPAFVFTAKGTMLKGSVRSIPGIDISQLIHIACEKDLLVTGGGHPMAGGLTFEYKKKEELISFIKEFFTQCAVKESQPIMHIDMAITFEQLRSEDFFQTLEILGPFGAEYPQPKFLLNRLKLTHIKPFGYNHLRMYGVQPNGESHAMVYFRQADKDIGKWLLTHPKELVDCVITVQADQRWGYQRAQIVLEDIR